MDFWSALHSDLQKSITTNKIYYLKSISYYENSKTIVHKSVFITIYATKVYKIIYTPNKNAKKSRLKGNLFGLCIINGFYIHLYCVFKLKIPQFIYKNAVFFVVFRYFFLPLQSELN